MSSIIEVTDVNFEQQVVKSDRPVLVDFWAPGVAPPARRLHQCLRKSQTSLVNN